MHYLFNHGRVHNANIQDNKRFVQKIAQVTVVPARTVSENVCPTCSPLLDTQFGNGMCRLMFHKALSQ